MATSRARQSFARRVASTRGVQDMLPQKRTLARRTSLSPILSAARATHSLRRRWQLDTSSIRWEVTSDFGNLSTRFRHDIVITRWQDVSAADRRVLDLARYNPRLADLISEAGSSRAGNLSHGVLAKLMQNARRAAIQSSAGRGISPSSG